MANKLNLYDTQSLWPLADRVAGIYTADVYAECDTLIVALFISAMGPGATLQLDVSEAVIGSAEGESESLGASDVLTLPGSKRYAVRGFLCRPTFTVTLTGLVRFGVVVSAKQNIPGVGAGTTDFANLITDGSDSVAEVSFAPSGLRNGGKVTEVTLNPNTWSLLPNVPLPNRNAMNVQNVSGEDIKLNYNSGQAGFVGMLIGAGSERSYDIKDTILVYGKSINSTITINVEEIS